MNKIMLFFYIFLQFTFFSNLYADEKNVLSADSGIVIRVMLISMLIWIALSIFIFSVNRKVKNLEKKFNDK